MKRKIITRLFSFATDKFLRLHGWKPESKIEMTDSGAEIRILWAKTTTHPMKSYETKPTVVVNKCSTAEAIRRALGDQVMKVPAP